MSNLAAAINVELHPRQSQAFETDATELLFGGATYGGKSHFMRCAAIIWCSMIPGLQVYLFRREYPDLYKNHMEGPTSFPALLAPWIRSGFAKINYGKNYIEFKNGSKIHLCHCQYDKDVESFDGAEIHVLLMDELTHFSEYVYRYLRSRCRLGALEVPERFKGLFPRIICATNPGGVGHFWVKASFIDIQPAFRCMQMSPEEGGLVRQFIPALAADNPTGLANDPNYMANQAGLGDPALVKAKRDGDWNIVAGGAFDDVWNDRVVLPRFVVPRSWRVDRSFDWGSSKPFSVGWWAEADGTEVEIIREGRKVKFAPPRGSLILCHEWYGTKKLGTNIGLKLGSQAVADGIKKREQELVANKWLNAQPVPGPADNAIDVGLDPGQPSIKALMAKHGVHWTESNKTPGSRKIGFELMREMLNETKKSRPEAPCLYVMDHCLAFLAHIPILPRDKKLMDDVDTSAEDHDYDMARYRVLAVKRTTSQGRLGI